MFFSANFIKNIQGIRHAGITELDYSIHRPIGPDVLHVS